VRAATSLAILFTPAETTSELRVEITPISATFTCEFGITESLPEHAVSENAASENAATTEIKRFKTLQTGN
jgi:hypothetical protein